MEQSNDSSDGLGQASAADGAGVSMDARGEIIVVGTPSTSVTPALVLTGEAWTLYWKMKQAYNWLKDAEKNGHSRDILSARSEFNKLAHDFAKL